MEAVVSSEKLLSTYESAWHHKEEESFNFNHVKLSFIHFKGGCVSLCQVYVNRRHPNPSSEPERASRQTFDALYIPRTVMHTFSFIQ
jgi:hypothetical protein